MQNERHVGLPADVTRSRRARWGRALLVLLCIVMVSGSVRFLVNNRLRDPITAHRASYSRFLTRQGAVLTAVDTTLLQTGFSDCAVAVMQELLRHMRRSPPTRDALARRLELSPRGVTLRSLQRALVQEGLATRRSTVADLNAEHAMVIALLNYRHYVLVREVTATSVAVFDPLVGRVVFPRAAFHRVWPGDGIVVEITQELGAVSATARVADMSLPSRSSGEVP